MKIADSSTIEHNVWIKLVDDDATVEIGAFTFIGTGTEINTLSKVEIGEHVLIAPGCFITDHNHGIVVERRIDQQLCIASAVHIGSDVWVGAQASILAGVTVGDGAIIGAGAVVREDVSPNAIVAGVPAKTVGMRTSKETS